MADTPNPSSSQGSAGADSASDSKKWIPWAVGGLVIVAIVAAFFLLSPSGDGVPDVVGMTTEDAEKAITDAGFAVGSVEASAVADTDEGIVLEQDPVAGTEAEEGSEVNIIVSVMGELTMPDVTGMTEDEAKAALEAEGLKVEAASYYVDEVEKGLVAGQLPDAGTVIEPGSEVGILVSLGKTPEETTKVKVPDVTGQQEKDAVSAITAVGLTVKVYYDSSESVAQGAVIDQEPSGGTEVAISSTVAILVSQGSEPTPPQPTTVEVPDVSGQTEADATKALSDAGLKAQSAPVYSDDVPKGSVVEQFPTAGTEVLVGSAVAIAVSEGPETPNSVEVPDVVNMKTDDAIAAIEAVGLKAMALRSDTPDGGDSGVVFAQLPAAGAHVDAGSTVLIIVRSGEVGEIAPTPMN